MKTVFLFIHLIIACACYAEAITPYKFTDSMPYYEIPPFSRFAVNRSEVAAPDVISYFSDLNKNLILKKKVMFFGKENNFA